RGLPLHPLVVHGAVVLLPLSALVLVLVTLVPPLRRRLGVLTPLLALLAAALVPVAISPRGRCSWGWSAPPRWCSITSAWRACCRPGPSRWPWWPSRTGRGSGCGRRPLRPAGPPGHARSTPHRARPVPRGARPAL